MQILKSGFRISADAFEVFRRAIRPRTVVGGIALAVLAHMYEQSEVKMPSSATVLTALGGAAVGIITTLFFMRSGAQSPLAYGSSSGMMAPGTGASELPQEVLTGGRGPRQVDRSPSRVNRLPSSATGASLPVSAQTVGTQTKQGLAASTPPTSTAVATGPLLASGTTPTIKNLPAKEPKKAEKRTFEGVRSKECEDFVSSHQTFFKESSIAWPGDTRDSSRGILGIASLKLEDGKFLKRDSSLSADGLLSSLTAIAGCQLEGDRHLLICRYTFESLKTHFINKGLAEDTAEKYALKVTYWLYQSRIDSFTQGYTNAGWLFYYTKSCQVDVDQGKVSIELVLNFSKDKICTAEDSSRVRVSYAQLDVTYKLNIA